MASRRWIVVGCLLPLLARAQGPLTIEQLLVEKRQWQLVSSAGFQSSDAASSSIGWSAGLRYGIGSRTEISARLAGSENRQGTGYLRRTQRTEAISAGLSWLAKPEDQWPALLIEINGDFASRPGEESPEYAGFRWALTSYRTIDPLVLSLTLRHRQSRAYGQGAGRISPGAAVTLESQLSFAANPQVTLFAGFGLETHYASSVGGQRIREQHQGVAMTGGFAYAPTSTHTVFLSASLDNRSRSAGLNIQWFLQF